MFEQQRKFVIGRSERNPAQMSVVRDVATKELPRQIVESFDFVPVESDTRTCCSLSFAPGTRQILAGAWQTAVKQLAPGLIIFLVKIVGCHDKSLPLCRRFRMVFVKNVLREQ